MAPPDPLRLLASVADDLAPALIPEPVGRQLAALVETARAVFAAAACSVAVLDDAGVELQYVASAGAGAASTLGLRLPVRRGIAGYVASSGQSLVVDEVRRDTRFASDVAERTGYVPTTILAVPIAEGDHVLGVLSVLDRGAATTGTMGQLELAGLFAQQAAEAIAIGAAVHSLGRMLLSAAGDAADDRDLAAALRRRARATPDGDGELAALASHVADLRRLGPAERAAATALLGEFVAYAGRRRGRR